MLGKGPRNAGFENSFQGKGTGATHLCSFGTGGFQEAASCALPEHSVKLFWTLPPLEDNRPVPCIQQRISRRIQGDS